MMYMDPQDRCEAEIERIIRDRPAARMGSRRIHRREHRRCPHRHVTYNTAMYPPETSNSMHTVSGMVCRRHTGYLQRKWESDWGD